MQRYYTGTTKECLESIQKDGFISITPPHRVWSKYSSEYIYLIPCTHKKESNENLIYFVMEQATKAIKVLQHSKRVILEIEGIEEDLLEKDTDADSIYSVKYPKNIPFDNIVGIYIEKEDNRKYCNALIEMLDLFSGDYKKKIETLKTQIHLFETTYKSDNKEEFTLLSNEFIKNLGYNGLSYLELYNIIQSNRYAENFLLKLLDKINNIELFESIK